MVCLYKDSVAIPKEEGAGWAVKWAQVQIPKQQSKLFGLHNSFADVLKQDSSSYYHTNYS